MSFSNRFGSWAGYAGVAFLVGVAAHSVWPYREFSLWWIAVALAVGCLLLFFHRASLLGLLVLSVALGVWRFEIARPVLPRNLQPFSAKGLAYAYGSSASASVLSVNHWLGLGKRTLDERATELFPADQAALLTGVLYGERGLSKPVKEQFRRAGLLHIIAVSGSNVTIVVGIVAGMLLAFGCSRRVAFLVIGSFLWLFVLFVSPSASVVRAAIMGLAAEAMPLLGRPVRAARLLLIAAVVFTVWQPWALLYDAGFALSFLAMWGLLTWTPLVQERWLRSLPNAGIRSVIASSLGATLMTMPYSAWAFGQASALGLLASLLVLPVVPWVMGSGVAALLLPQITFIKLAAQGFLVFVLWVARWVSDLPFGVWTSLALSWWSMLGWYAALWIAYAVWQKRTVDELRIPSCEKNSSQ